MCQARLNWVTGLMITVGTLITGFVAAGVVAMALNGLWVTAVFGAAAVAVGICALLAVAVVSTLIGLAAALDSYHECMGRQCQQAYNNMGGALLAIGSLTGTSLYPLLALAGALAWVPGAALPPLVALLGLFVLIGGLIAAFGFAWSLYLRCHLETHGSVTSPVRSGSGSGGGGGGSGGGGSGGGGGPRTAGIRGPNLLAALNVGNWFKRWPSGTVIDGTLGPDVCPICLYSIVIGGTIARLQPGENGELPGVELNGGELLTFNADGKLQPQPFSYVRLTSGPNPELPLPLVQGLVSENGGLKAVIGGDSSFDFGPYLVS